MIACWRRRVCSVWGNEMTGAESSMRQPWSHLQWLDQWIMQGNHHEGQERVHFTWLRMQGIGHGVMCATRWASIVHATKVDRRQLVAVVTVSHVLGRPGVRFGQNWGPKVPNWRREEKGVKWVWKDQQNTQFAAVQNQRIVGLLCVCEWSLNWL